MQRRSLLSMGFVLVSLFETTTDADAQSSDVGGHGGEHVSRVFGDTTPAGTTRQMAAPEEARLRALARRERRLGYTSGILFLVGLGTSIGAAGASWQTSSCEDDLELCSLGGERNLLPGRFLGGTSIALLSGSWATSIGAGVVGRRVAGGLELAGLDPMWPRARASMSLASIPFFGTWGLTSPWIATRHARRALYQLDRRGGATRDRLSSLRLRVRLDVGASAGAVSFMGLF